jgi:hypothetical protein
MLKTGYHRTLALLVLIPALGFAVDYDVKNMPDFLAGCGAMLIAGLLVLLVISELSSDIN